MLHVIDHENIKFEFTHIGCIEELHGLKLIAEGYLPAMSLLVVVLSL